MRKFILSILFSFAALQLYSQYRINYDLIRYGAAGMWHTEYANWISINLDSNIQKNGITQKTETHYRLNSRKSNKEKLRQENSYYDSLGYLIKSTITSSKGIDKVVKSYVYESNALLSCMEILVNGKSKYRVYFTYDSSKHKTSYAFYEGKKLKTFNRWVYKNNKLTEQFQYKGDTEVFKYHFTYAYLNDTGKLLLSHVENNKSKILYTWDYRCMESGPQSKKESKKETRICKSSLKLPEGQTQEIWEQAIEGEIFRYIYLLDSQRRTLSLQSFRGKSGEKLHYDQKFSYSGDTIFLTSANFDIHTGKLTSMSEYISISGYGYISQLNTFYNGKGKVRSVWEQQYTYEGDLLKVSKWMSLKYPKYEYINEYHYLYRDGH